MHSFDHRFFPHIMDMIFDYADDESLPILGQVCGQWRRKFAAEFYWLRNFAAWNHVEAEDSDYEDEAEDEEDTAIVECPQFVFETTSGRSVITNDLVWLDWLSPCKVVDLDVDVYVCESDEELFVDILRVPYPLDDHKGRPVDLTCLQCTHIVFDNNFRLKTHHDIVTIVINHRNSDFGYFKFSRNSAKHYTLHRAVFIAHPQELIQGTRSADACAEKLFSLFRTLWPSVSLTYVADEMSERLAHFAELKHYTFEAYRKMVGEESFAIHTDFTNPLSIPVGRIEPVTLDRLRPLPSLSSEPIIVDDDSDDDKSST